MANRRTLSVKQSKISPWVDLVTRDVSDFAGSAVFHPIGQADYVSVLAISDRDEIILIRQYRPAVLWRKGYVGKFIVPLPELRII